MSCGLAVVLAALYTPHLLRPIRSNGSTVQLIHAQAVTIVRAVATASVNQRLNTASLSAVSTVVSCSEVKIDELTDIGEAHDRGRQTSGGKEGPCQTGTPGEPAFKTVRRLRASVPAVGGLEVAQQHLRVRCEEGEGPQKHKQQQRRLRFLCYRGTQSKTRAWVEHCTDDIQRDGQRRRSEEDPRDDNRGKSGGPGQELGRDVFRPA